MLTLEKKKALHWDKDLEPGQLGKPLLELDLTPQTNLFGLLGTNSFLLWDILGLDWQWLKLSPVEWEKSTAYQESMSVLLRSPMTVQRVV